MAQEKVLSEASKFIQKHAYALDVSGYTIVPGQVTGAELEQLRESTDRAIAAVGQAVRADRKPKYTGGTAYYLACRCMYCWGPACVRLLEHDLVHQLSTTVLKHYHLWDMTALCALPTPPTAEKATTSWHFDPDPDAQLYSRPPSYLWFFLCLDDLTAENGATWVVPGSHRVASEHAPALGSAWTGDQLDDYPSRIQVCARAGDMVVMDATMLHTSGRNTSSRPRRLLAVNMCHAKLSPLLDHWALVGPEIRRSAGDRLRKIFGPDKSALEGTWDVLPEGWTTA
jgi:Phytanoyl-CoA dioxygenase (PhyH)